MSVINKMLRDLDLRQVGQTVGAAGHGAQPELRQGTASVGFAKTVAAQQTHPRLRLWLGIGLLLALVLAAGAWAWWLSHATGVQAQASATAGATDAVLPTSTSTSTQTPMPMPAAGTTMPTVSSPVASAVASVSLDGSPAPTHTAPSPATGTSTTAMSLRMESSLSAQRALDALLSAPAPALSTAAATPPPQLPAARASASPMAAPVAQAPATAASVPAKSRTPVSPTNGATASTATANDSTPAVQRQQQAGGDAMAQAQTLWNAGSHDAAIDLMQQSIAAAERSAKTAGNPAGSTVLLALVREMTRMQLAEGRHGAVWELLTRLEPLLGNQPDLWAIRANAAQRLGRHQDSVHAYMMALQSRPDEQRWLLGTAVSLAALGQTSSATEMAERARTLAPISKDILNYLRQAGVTLRDPP